MFITLHCGGIPFNGDTIETRSLGGSETAAYYVARALAALGHKVTLFTNEPAEHTRDGVRYLWSGNPTESAPLGERFTFYAENTPCDLLIVQRHPQAFQRRFAAKVNMLWLHDLALQRAKPSIHGQAWNVDRFLTVSNFHREQVIAEWGLTPANVVAIRNGIDPALYADRTGPRDKYALVYSSRPERGLEHLVRPGGIMERLAKEAPRYHLHVCGYDNTTPHMAEFYRRLWERCDALPNVTNHGPLTKAELAQLMKTSNALIYPTEFEEVSCITAMEAMAAGLPFVSSAHAALPETCAGAGAYLIPLKDGKADEDKFVEFFTSGSHLAMAGVMRDAQYAAAEKLGWAGVADLIVKAAEEVFADNTLPSLLNHYIRHSDIPVFDKVVSETAGESADSLSGHIITVADRAYDFFYNDYFAKHYAAYYQYEKDRGVEYGPEDVTGTTRFRAVAGLLQDLPEGSVVMDYGCAHGHYTIGLAKLFPHLGFVGVDITASNIATARKWAERENLPNVIFQEGDATSQPLDITANAIIAAEVVEHVACPRALLSNLAKSFNGLVGTMIVTTPYGPWEAQGYTEHKFWRAHLHHFERADLHDMLGHYDGFNVLSTPSGQSFFGSALGSYVVRYNVKPGDEGPRAIDLARKRALTVADQTVSVCIIAKNAEADIARCLRSVTPFAQQIIIGVDRTTTDRTMSVIRDMRTDYPLIDWQVFVGEPATEVGFAAARNATLARANGDWILWIDTDEVMHGNPLPMLRRNQFAGYAVEQHHVTAEPPGIMKVDLPVRFFRNRLGVKFFGYVHEHPELKLNEGLGNVCMLQGVRIMHHGYTTEEVRRKRFGRNIGLLERDRREHPDRILGKFLWLRDLAQMTQYEVEQNAVNPAVAAARAKESCELWRELVKNNLRMAVDALPFYSALNNFLPGSFEFGFSMAASKMNGGLHPEREQFVSGLFASTEDVSALLETAAKEKMAHFNSRYF